MAASSNWTPAFSSSSSWAGRSFSTRWEESVCGLSVVACSESAFEAVRRRFHVRIVGSGGTPAHRCAFVRGSCANEFLRSEEVVDRVRCHSKNIKATFHFSFFLILFFFFGSSTHFSLVAHCGAPPCELAARVEVIGHSRWDWV